MVVNCVLKPNFEYVQKNVRAWVVVASVNGAMSSELMKVKRLAALVALSVLWCHTFQGNSSSMCQLYFGEEPEAEKGILKMEEQ